MRDLLERLATKEPGVLWALVAIIVGYAIWAVWADRGRGRHDRAARKR
jgi:hypothetical protein